MNRPIKEFEAVICSFSLLFLIAAQAHALGVEQWVAQFQNFQASRTITDSGNSQTNITTAAVVINIGQKRRLENRTRRLIAGAKSEKSAIALDSIRRMGKSGAGGQETADCLVKIALNSEEEGQRNAAVRSMINLGGENLYKSLAFILAHAAKKFNDASMPHAAVSAIRNGRHTDEGAVDFLEHIAINYKEAAPSAASALGEIGGERAVEVLSKMAQKNDSSRTEKIAVISALAKIGGDQVVGPLTKTAVNGEDDYAQMIASNTIARMNTEKSRSALKQIKNKSNNLLARGNAILALRR